MMMSLEMFLLTGIQESHVHFPLVYFSCRGHAKQKSNVSKIPLRVVKVVKFDYFDQVWSDDNPYCGPICK